MPEHIPPLLASFTALERSNSTDVLTLTHPATVSSTPRSSLEARNELDELVRLQYKEYVKLNDLRPYFGSTFEKLVRGELPDLTVRVMLEAMDNRYGIVGPILLEFHCLSSSMPHLVEFEGFNLLNENKQMCLDIMLANVLLPSDRFHNPAGFTALFIIERSGSICGRIRRQYESRTGVRHALQNPEPRLQKS